MDAPINALSISASAFTGAGLLTLLELIFLTFFTFRRWSGLYFYSFLIAAIAQIELLIYNVLWLWVDTSSCGWVLIFFGVTGYVLYVPAQAMILYSRLHLLLASDRLLRTIIILAALEFILFEIPVTIFIVLDAVMTAPVYDQAYAILIQIEAVAYLLMDCAFMAAYIYQIRKIWPKEEALHHQKRILRQIVGMSIFLVIVDIIFIIMTYKANIIFRIGCEVSTQASQNTADFLDIPVHLQTQARIRDTGPAD
jgi:hypothetical protein